MLRGLRTLALCAFLAGCASAGVVRVGNPIPMRFPQAAEQCRAQPDLDWCRHARR